ncbi:hypothetical protein ACJ73_09426 [Blastomyces percursus]|uniref:3-hydroxyacyl-CoA dehydrogenase NAD binding domain-containing protein n=1 Tax=Blastomyces percursus TaxID=1658174 RepID=A0A1J9Q9W8_9EURO|nr:hypothetical protein ACJ73_09426 [Blastomyces percursus]
MSADKLPKPTRITPSGQGQSALPLPHCILHKSPNVEVAIYDTRPDLKAYIEETLPRYLATLSGTHTLPDLLSSHRLTLSPDLPTAVFTADIVETHDPTHALFWPSTSGIPASTQPLHMRDKSRLIVVHPYNPPHIMPLLELVPSPATPPTLIERTRAYWKALERAPVLLRQETTGFVANRLAYALLREAVHLVQEGVVGVEELDVIVENSMGTRWTVVGPLKSYHMGRGVEGPFLRRLGARCRRVGRTKGKWALEGGGLRGTGVSGDGGGLWAVCGAEKTKAVLKARGRDWCRRTDETVRGERFG